VIVAASFSRAGDDAAGEDKARIAGQRGTGAIHQRVLAGTRRAHDTDEHAASPY
jgi:hypothetical protein